MKFTANIKNLLFAHPGNSYQPLLLKGPALLLTAGGLVLLQFSYFQLHSGDGRVLGIATAISSSEVIEVTNRQRLANGVPQLRLNHQLRQAAQAKADDMAERGYWSHSTPEGMAPWYFMERSGYSYELAGENLARGFNTSTGVVAGWMNSPSHRDNLLDIGYQEIGVAIANGMIEGEETTVVVAMYGTQNSSQLLDGVSEALRYAYGQQTAFSVLNPLPWQQTLGWASKISLPVLGAIGLTQISQHVVLKRKKLRWDRHNHTHPVVMLIIILAAATAMITASFGTIL